MLQEIIDCFLKELKFCLDRGKKYPTLTDTYPPEAITLVVDRVKILYPYVTNPLDTVHAMMFIVGMWELDAISKQIAHELLEMDEFFWSDITRQDKLFIKCCTWERIEDPQLSLTTFQIFMNILKCELILLEKDLDDLEDEFDKWVRLQ